MTKRLLLAAAALGLVLQAADFETQIHPILARRCIGCHSGAQPQGRLSLESRAAAGRVLERGGMRLMSRLNGEAKPQMPPTGAPLTAAEVALIQEWLDQGAVWPEAPAKVSSNWVAPLEPRRPPLPEGTASNPIDRFVEAYWKANNVAKPALVADALFARRASYDLIGLPSDAPADLDRVKLVDRLLADKKRYAGHWISFWNDLLHNDIGVVYHGDRKAITPWLEAALESNMPYDEMVRQLVNPTGPNAPEGFLIGVNWRGDVNASQTPFMQASQNTAQVFLGINLKCASCHDSFINRYKLKQAYGLAAMFSEQPKLELVRCDAKTGKFTEAEFLFPEIGAVPAGLPLAERRAAAAKLFTDPRNGRLARTLVNRYWQKLFGRGIVEPVDDMDAQPWYPDLLDWLASDFADHHYDLQYLLRLMMTSNAYQSVTSTAADAKVFRGPLPRRITAEQFVDTVSAVTGEWRTLAAGETAQYVRDWQLKSSPLTRAMGRPIRDQVFTTREIAPTTFQALELVNGASLGLMLRRGARRLLNQLPEPPGNRYDSRTQRKGTVPFDIPIEGVKQLWILLEDSGSYDPIRTIAGLAAAELVTAQGAVRKLTDVPTLDKVPTGNITVAKAEVKDVQLIPLGRTLIYNIEGLGATRLRGQLVIDDVGQESDVGSSVRLFVFSQEPDRQQLIKVAGSRPVAPPSTAAFANRDQAIRYCYRSLLARDPSDAELTVARRYLGSQKIEAAGLEDLLWSLLMHPEFQYIW